MSTPADTLLITGVAGFIGFHCALRLLVDGQHVAGIDNINDYYDPKLKRARLALLARYDTFTFIEGDLADDELVRQTFGQHSPARVIHLAAQAGVRYSLQNPRAYIDSNIQGFFNVMQASVDHGVDHFVFASSSSVYGANLDQPLSVERPADHPINLYAATKRSNELMAHAYSHLYGLPCTGLRFFTVYGPWGRPDMAYFKFTRSIIAGEAIDVYNHGNMYRDFTYIDDIVESVVRILDLKPAAQPLIEGRDLPLNGGCGPFAIYNIGGHKPEHLMNLIRLLETFTGKTADLNMLPMQPGEIQQTYADVETLSRATGFTPEVGLEEGLERFVAWYKSYYGT